MPSNISFLVTYPCPRCGVSLEAQGDEWRDWLRCPSCGRAGRPPYERRMSRQPAEEVLYIGTFVTGPGTNSGNGSASPYGGVGLPTTGLGDYAAQGGAARRILLGGGFFVAVFLALVSVVQKNPGQAGVFGFVAFLLLVFLAQASRRA